MWYKLINDNKCKDIIITHLNQNQTFTSYPLFDASKVSRVYFKVIKLFITNIKTRFSPKQNYFAYDFYLKGLLILRDRIGATGNSETY